MREVDFLRRRDAAKGAIDKAFDKPPALAPGATDIKEGYVEKRLHEIRG